MAGRAATEVTIVRVSVHGKEAHPRESPEAKKGMTAKGTLSNPTKTTTYIDDLAVVLARLGDDRVEAPDNVGMAESLIGCVGDQGLIRSAYKSTAATHAPSTSLRAALTESPMPLGHLIFFKANSRPEAVSWAR